MTDFLTSLAARTIAKPALQPRTRARFEPPTAAAAPVWPERDRTVMPAAAEPQAAMPSHAVPPSISAVVPPAQPLVRPVHNGTGLRGPSDRSDPPRSDDSVTAIASAAAPQPPPIEAPRSEAPQTRTIVRTESPQPRIERVIETVVRPAPPTQQEPHDSEGDHDPRVGSPTPPAQRPHRHDEAPPRVETVDRTTVERETTIERQRTTVEGRMLAGPSTQPRTSPAAAAAASPEPIIQVSIGRIEVRAATPAAAPRRESAHGPMTIEEYVARRDAKERAQ